MVKDTVVVVTSRIPWPAASGAERRVSQHIELLRSDYRVVLVTVNVSLPGVSANVAANEVGKTVDRVVVVPANPRWWRWFRVFRGEPIQVARGYERRMGQAVRDVVSSEKPAAAYFSLVRTGPYIDSADCPVVLDYCDALNLQFRLRAQSSSRPLRWLWRTEAWLLRRYERRLAARIDAACVTTRVDAAAISGESKPAVVSNAFDLAEPEFEAEGHSLLDEVGGPIVIMTGDMSTPYSEKGARWFVQAVWPKIQMNVPDATMMIVGREPTSGIRSLVSVPGVVVTGRVPRVSDYLAVATVAVAPLGPGTGVKNRLLEAFAAGVPVVMTSSSDTDGSIAAAGAALVADDSAAFAQRVVHLLADETVRSSVTQSAKQYVESNFSSQRVRADLSEVLQRARRLYAGVSLDG